MIHSHILHNGQICEAASAQLRAGQIGLLAGWGVFSTLRIADGVPFAWERHWARMSRDAALLHVPMPPDADLVEHDLHRLIDANGQSDCTLRLVVLRNGGGMWEGPESKATPFDVIAVTADSKRWGDSVRLGVQPNARFAGSEFAGAKILSWAQNLTWAERAQQQGLDEVVLLNQHGLVAECTSANIFAVFGDEVLTPPLTDGCLPGITREVLLECVQLRGIRIVERSLSLYDLYGADEVFVTSTTRDLLPVREFAGRETGVITDVRERLSPAFSAFVKADIAQRKSVIARRKTAGVLV
jgi:branched-chain amino acid aminotransferase